MSDASSHSETLSVSEKNDLGQGDIIRLVGSEKPPHWGVIINADCDLANGKTDGVISYLPVYSLREYLAEFWLNEFLSGQRNQIVKNILDTCKLPATDFSTLVQWLQGDDNHEVVESLSDSLDLNKKAKDRLDEQVKTYLCAFHECVEPDRQFKALCSCQKKPDQFAQKQVQSAYNQMGDGHLVLNELHGVSEMGFVVRMRRIYSLDEGVCFRSEHQFLTNGSQPDFAAIRICRLSGVFQFKLAQLFAYQFSRVGLPDVFREMHSLVLDDVARRFSEDTE